MYSNERNGLILDQNAYQGVLGEFLKYVEPFTEADNAAILIQALAGLGIYMGPDFYKIAGDAQRGKLFVVIVGNSSKARKGTSWGIVYELLSAVDSYFTRNRILSGFGSGEAIIGKLKDSDVSDRALEVDPRLVVAGGEFAQILQVMNREGNTLSAVIRDGWDNRPMSSIVKSGELKVSNHHIGLISHITNEELLGSLKRHNYFNGFANRFLYVWSKRSKMVPFPEPLDPGIVQSFGIRIRESIRKVKDQVGTELRMSPESSDIWADTYPELSRDRYGLTGAVLSRAEAQVIRLAVIYAVLDGSSWIEPGHMRAALAVWEYSEASVNRIFEQIQSGNEDRIVSLLKEAGKLKRTDIHSMLGNNLSGAEIDRIKESLVSNRFISVNVVHGGRGRPSEEWTYVPPTE